MNCIAIDDEQKALDVLVMYAEKIDTLNLIGTFTDPIEASRFVESHQVDLIFLDINMPGMNGFEFLESLTKKPQVIFTTAYSEYAAQSYSVDALDYLVKPIPFGRFLKAINKFEKPASKSTSVASTANETISIKSGTAMHIITLDQLLYVEADGNYMKFVTQKEKIMALMTMKGAIELLSKSDLFMQVHRSYIVAISKIEKIEAHQLTIDKTVIPIGASYRREVLERLNF